MTHPAETAAALRRARAVIADIPAHDDATLADACWTIAAHSMDPAEITDAAQLVQRLKGKAA